MNKRICVLITSFSIVAFDAVDVRAESIVIAEDDASHSNYGGQWDNSKNGGSGFGNWSLTVEGNEAERHAGFFVATTKNNPDLNGISKDDKAFGTFANGTGFEQAVAYRPFDKPLQPGDSFSFMMENGPFEKKYGTDDSTPGSIGLALRTSNANTSVADYNKDAVFEFGYYNGKNNYQIFDGSGADKADSGVPFTDSGISVTVTITGPDTYDLEIQTLKDKSLTKLPGRKFSAAGSIQSFAIFNRNGERNDAYFNQFQVARPSN
ncbi:MAG TPA: hypothetical protein VJ719_06660 [Chthoniobacterales bacterium]|nr:hypothetical protein [Chthoniobacterales bacterium]